MNGQPVALDVPATIVAGRTLVPLRFIAEALGARVGWYEQARFITVNPVERAVEVTVVRVVDGDTVDVRLDGAPLEERIRLVGVDTPEVHGQTEFYGPEASTFAKGLLPDGTRMTLELGDRCTIGL